MPFPVDRKHIDRAEQKLGILLPHGYIARMERSNGGAVAVFDDADDFWELIPIFDDSDKQRLKRTCNDVVRETKLAREWSGFPQTAVAIGHNGGGDILVFLPNDTGDRLSDVVYWWDHETGELTRVSNDFGELQSA